MVNLIQKYGSNRIQPPWYLLIMTFLCLGMHVNMCVFVWMINERYNINTVVVALHCYSLMSTNAILLTQTNKSNKAANPSIYYIYLRIYINYINQSCECESECVGIFQVTDNEQCAHSRCPRALHVIMCEIA